MTQIVLAQNDAAAAGFVVVLLIIYLAVLALMIASAWKIFTKAGEEGWKAIIPIYNGVVLMQIIGRPVWWVALFLLAIIPIIGTIAVLALSVIIAIDVAKSFGKDTGFGIGLALLGPIFYPILAFGDARYIGPAGPEPRPGWPNVGQQGIAGGYGAPQWGQQPDQWGQQPQQPQQWGQQPQQWGQPPAPDQQWGQQPQQPDQPQWGQPPQPPQQPDQWGQPQQPQQWGQQPQQGWGEQPRQSDGGYPPPPVS